MRVIWNIIPKPSGKKALNKWTSIMVHLKKKIHPKSHIYMDVVKSVEKVQISKVHHHVVQCLVNRKCDVCSIIDLNWSDSSIVGRSLSYSLYVCVIELSPLQGCWLEQGPGAISFAWLQLFGCVYNCPELRRKMWRTLKQQLWQSSDAPANEVVKCSANGLRYTTGGDEKWTWLLSQWLYVFTTLEIDSQGE